jgi:hypothetical protein
VTERVPVAPTIGEIARRLAVPIHRVEYIVRSRDLAPASWAGNCRVFSEADVTFIGAQIRRTDAERERTAL